MKNEFLRHMLSTINYRFDKSIAESKEGFDAFNLGNGSRNPTEIMNHMYGVLHWARTSVEKKQFNPEGIEKLSLMKEIERFKQELIKIDSALDVDELPLSVSKKLIQGPLSDILTHIGQIAMMQRLHGKPVPPENYSVSSIETGLN